SWCDVLPYFRKSETSWRGGSEFRGATGPLTVNRVDVAGPVFDATIETARNLGYPIADDPHGAGAGEGFTLPEVTVDGGRRASTATRYLRPALRRPNLQVVTGGFATRI